VNNQRSMQAFEVAEAGLEYTIGLLSGGRVDNACVPTNDVSLTTFKERHLTQRPDGTFIPSGGQPALRPTCVLLSAGAQCSCPAVGAPNLIVPVGLAPTFQVQFQTGIGQPGIVRAVSRGCSSIGKQCYDAMPGNAPADAVTEVSVLLGLNSALATLPSAAVTAGGTVNLNGAASRITNTDVPSRGTTINSGGPVVNADAAHFISSPGTPGAGSILASDPTLLALNADRMFVAMFGMDRATYRSQPAAVRVTCAADCGSAIASAVSDNPGRVIWVEGPATIGTEIALGAPGAPPVMLFVQGNLSVSSNLTLNGVLYLHDPSGGTTWATNAGTTVIQGAVIAEGNLSVTGTPSVVFNPAILRTINLTQGSMVRIPGSWRDFAGS
jgi:hypothetical protein